MTGNAQKLEKGLFVMFRNFVKNDHLLQATLIPGLIFLPLVFAEFGRLDDFVFYLYTRNDVSGVIQSGLTYGRPVTSFIIGETFSRVNSIQDLSALRFLSLICLVLILFFTGKFYSKPTTSQFTFGALAFISLPGLWVFLTWAQGLPHILALIFLVVGSICYLQTRYRWMFYLLSTLAIFTYQPFALLFPVLLMSRIIGDRDVTYKKHFLKISSWLIFLSFLNYALVKSQSTPNVRSSITKDYSEKMDWFLNEWAPRVTFPWSLSINLALSAVSILLFVLLMVNYFLKEKNLKGPIMLICMCFPGIPFVISAENWASSRAIFASNIAYFIVMAFFITSLGASPTKTLIRNVVATSSVTYLLYLAAMNGYQGLVFPQVQEWGRLEQEVRLISGASTAISGQISLFEQTSSPILSYDEFGVLNSSVETALRGMITLAKFGTQVESVPVLIGTDRLCQLENSYFESPTKTYVLRPLSGMAGCN